MNIFMIGEASNHASTLQAGLTEGATIVPLPREAAYEPVGDDAMEDGDVVISLRFRREGAAPRFRMLHVPGAGLDGIDFDSLAPETVVCNVFEHEIPIAEYVLSGMLEWEIRAGAMRRDFRTDNWPDIYRNRVPHGEICGKTLGLIGFGRIGRAIAVRARAFGMRVVALDRSATGDGIPDEILRPGDLPALLQEADYLVVACPLSPETRGMIGAPQLAAMRPDAVLINVSRAEIVDEAALYDALSTRRIGGAILDVWYSYPAGSDDRVAPCSLPFHDLDNAVCTPHSSAWTENLPKRRYARIAENIERLRRGEALENVVRAAGPAPDPQQTHDLQTGTGPS
jgi:phosphoglycerate dehydrogenase-like enzyme